MRTTIARPQQITPRWYLVDASQERLGRMAVEIARRLMGKHHPLYTPHVDTGDYVVVVNAARVQVSGVKDAKKIYRRHTGYPGGLRETTLAEMRRKRPQDIVRLAVRRMLPKTTLGRHMLAKLKVYGGPDHAHQAQKPEPLSFGTGR